MTRHFRLQGGGCARAQGEDKRKPAAQAGGPPRVGTALGLRAKIPTGAVGSAKVSRFVFHAGNSTETNASSQ